MSDVTQILHQLDAGDAAAAADLLPLVYDEEEPRDKQLQESLEEMFLTNCAKYEKSLTKKYGAPAQEGTTQHRDIPLNGVLRYVIWSIKKKKLYLAVCHEDRELPWVICLGTSV